MFQSTGETVMDEKMTRRGFLKTGAMALGAVAAYEVAGLGSALAAPTSSVEDKAADKADDKACVDLVYAQPGSRKRALVERIESRTGLRQLEYMKMLGMGNDQYELITV
jgi:hypothetical protein